MKSYASFAIARIELLISKEQYKIDNPLTQVGQWPASTQELENRIKGMQMIIKVIEENPNPGSGSHNARFEGIILATCLSLKNKTDKSEPCGVLVGMAQAVNAYNQVSKELANLKSA